MVVRTLGELLRRMALTDEELTAWGDDPEAFVASESADADGASDGASDGAARPAAVRLFCLLTARFGDVCLSELAQLFARVQSLAEREREASYLGLGLTLREAVWERQAEPTVLAVLAHEAANGLSSRLIARRVAWLLGIAAPLLSADGTLHALRALHALIGAADGMTDAAVRLTAVAALKRFVRRSGSAAPLPAGVAEPFAGATPRWARTTREWGLPEYSQVRSCGWSRQCRRSIGSGRSSSS